MIKKELLEQADKSRGTLLWNKDFKTDFTYSNGVIEGSSLTIENIRELIKTKIPVEGKQESDSYAAMGFMEAYNYVVKQAETKNLDITEEIIRNIHKLIYQNIQGAEAGQYRTENLYIPDLEYTPPTSDEVDHLMHHFIQQMEISKKMFHPIEYAVICHKRILDIQPFSEGNGYVARLLMNLVIAQQGYHMINIPQNMKSDYIRAIIKSQKSGTPDIDTIIQIIMDCYLK